MHKGFGMVRNLTFPQLLRLLQINNGVFIKVTKATTEMLKIVEPWIAYGYHRRTVDAQAARRQLEDVADFARLVGLDPGLGQVQVEQIKSRLRRRGPTSRPE